MDELAMIAENEQDRMEYLSHRLAVMDEQARMKDAAREGFERGELVGRVRVCQSLMKRSPDSSEELAGWPLQELRRLAESLEAQVQGLVQ